MLYEPHARYSFEYVYRNFGVPFQRWYQHCLETGIHELSYIVVGNSSYGDRT